MRCISDSRLRALPLFLAVFATAATAATFQWTGGTSDKWNNAGNWSVVSGTDADSIPDNDDVVEFYASASNLATSNDRAAGGGITATLGGLVFLATATSPVSIAGNIISFGTGNSGVVVKTGAADPTVSAQLTTTTAGGLLVIDVEGASQTLTTTANLNVNGLSRLNLVGLGTVKAASTFGGSSFNLILDIDAGTLDLFGGNGSIGRLVGGGGFLTSSSATTRTLTSMNSSANATNDTAITGNLNLACGRTNFADAGDKTQVLTANNTYTGTTTINTGTLRVNGTTSGQGNYVVNGRTSVGSSYAATAATLAGLGSIGLANNATMTVNYTPNANVTGTALSTVAPGVASDTATLTVGTAGNNNSVVFGGASGQGGQLRVEIGAAGAADRLAINGALDLSAANDRLQLVSLSGALDGSGYTVATHTGSRSGKFSSVYLDATVITATAETGFAVGGKTYRLVYDANAIRLEVPVRGTLITIR